MASDNMSAIQRSIAGTTPKTDQARILKSEFIKWYDKLSWLEQNEVTGNAYPEARKRRDAFFAANATTPQEMKAAKAVQQTPVSDDNTRPSIQQGSHGEVVKEWQRIIGEKDDGDFGRKTTKTTKLWQASHGLTADGRVGPKTWTVALGKEITKAAAKTGGTSGGAGTASTSAKPSTATDSTSAKPASKIQRIKEEFKDTTSGVPLWGKIVGGVLILLGIGAGVQAVQEANKGKRKAA